MFAVALIDVRIWFRYAYGLYFGALLLLGAVEFVGTAGMGAQRWIDLKVIQLQPSEVMKVALVVALARFFHGQGDEELARPTTLVVPLALVTAPAALVLKQPDLGTAMMLLMAAGAVFFVAGARLWMFALAAVLAGAAVPIGWQFLRDYQRQRVLTFLDPESDPLGAGYHILQSKIALGSGGQKQTDFIFTMLAEEFGMIGGLVLLGLFFLLFVYGFAIALRSRNQFGRILAIGLTANLFLYVFINIAMVMGLIPVVGVPLPLISYGGTAMLAVMLAFGLVMSVWIHRDIRIPRRGLGDT
jgi:rod shape determining protein RodA